MGKKDAENDVKHECLNNFQLNEKLPMQVDTQSQTNMKTLWLHSLVVLASYDQTSDKK